MAGAVPDITPYFSQTYAQGMENARLQIKADLEKDLAREASASAMARTLVGGAFNIGGQLGSAALAHYLREPLESAKATTYGYERAAGETLEEGYARAVKQAATAKYAEKFLTEEEKAAQKKWLPEGLILDIEAEGVPTMAEYAAPIIARGMAGLKEKGIPTTREFLIKPGEYGAKFKSARAEELYHLSQRGKTAAETDIAEKYWKKSERMAKIQQKARVDGQKIVNTTDLSRLTASGITQRGFPTFKWMFGSELAKNGVWADPKGRLYLQRQIGDELVPLKEPLSQTQIRWLNEDIDFTVAAPLTGDEHNLVRKLLKQVAIPLKEAGRMSVSIYNKGRREREKIDPPIFIFNSGPNDKTPIQVRLDDVLGAMMADITDKSGKSLPPQVDRMMAWLTTPKNKSMKIGAFSVKGVGLNPKVAADNAKLVKIEGMLNALKNRTASDKVLKGYAEGLFGKGASKQISIGFKLFIREHLEGHRGASVKALKGGDSTKSVTPEAKKSSLRAKFSSVFSKPLKRYGGAASRVRAHIASAVKAARAKAGASPTGTVRVRIQYGADKGGEKTVVVSGVDWSRLKASPTDKDLEGAFRAARAGRGAYDLLLKRQRRFLGIKYFVGAVKNFANEAKKLGVDEDGFVGVFRNSFPDAEVLTDDELRDIFQGKGFGGGIWESKAPSVQEPGEDKFSRAMRAIAGMDVDDKSKNRRFSRFLASMGA